MIFMTSKKQPQPRQHPTGIPNFGQPMRPSSPPQGVQGFPVQQPKPIPVSSTAKSDGNQTITKRVAAIETMRHLETIKQMSIISLVVFLVAFALITYDPTLGTIATAGYLIYAAYRIYMANRVMVYLRYKYGV